MDDFCQGTKKPIMVVSSKEGTVVEKSGIW